MRRLILTLLPIVFFSIGFSLSGEAAAQSKQAVKQAKKKQAKKKQAHKKIQVLILKVEGIDKAKPAKVKALRKSLKKLKGVVRVRPRPRKGALVVRHRPGADVDAIRAAVAEAGFTILADKATPTPPPAAAESEGEIDEPIPEE